MKKQLTKIFQSICTNVYVHLSFFKIRVSGIKNIMSAGNDLMWKEAFVLVVTVFKRLRHNDEDRTAQHEQVIFLVCSVFFPVCLHVACSRLVKQIPSSLTKIDYVYRLFDTVQREGGLSSGLMAYPSCIVCIENMF